MGDAIGCALRQWDALTRYLDDGLLEIDNNAVERQMRLVAVGRKNWMFAGSAEGGHRAAIIYSIVCTCGLLGIEPWAYLKDVLQRLAEGEEPAALTPRIWKEARERALLPADRADSVAVVASGGVGGPGAYGSRALPVLDPLDVSNPAAAEQRA